MPRLRHGRAQGFVSNDPARFAAWTAAWADLVDFEVHPVVASKEAYEALKPEL